jgi:hypothetical protein
VRALRYAERHALTVLRQAREQAERERREVAYAELGALQRDVYLAAHGLYEADVALRRKIAEYEQGGLRLATGSQCWPFIDSDVLVRWYSQARWMNWLNERPSREAGGAQPRGGRKAPPGH